MDGLLGYLPFTAAVLASLSSHVAAQLPVGTSTVGGVAEYMGTAVATAPLGMPTLAWNCAKMPAICENVNTQNPLSSDGLGYGSLQSGPIELHFDVNADGRSSQRGQTACPSGWSSRNCRPGISFSGSQVVCADGDTLSGNCFPGELWQRNDGSTQCLATPFISYPGGDAPTALIWSCDEWPPKSTVEGGSGASSSCAPLGVSVIGSNLLPAAVLAAENQIYSRSEQNYQGNAQNALRQYVSGQNPPLLGIWAFEFDTFYDDDAGSYATRVTYPTGGGSQGTTGFVSRDEDIAYRSEFQMANGSFVVVEHLSNSFDRRGRLAPKEERSEFPQLLLPRQNVTANSTLSSTTTSPSSTTITTSTPSSLTTLISSVRSNSTLLTRNSTTPSSPSTSLRPSVPIGTGSSILQNSVLSKTPIGTGFTTRPSSNAVASGSAGSNTASIGIPAPSINGTITSASQQSGLPSQSIIPSNGTLTPPVNGSAPVPVSSGAIPTLSAPGNGTARSQSVPGSFSTITAANGSVIPSQSAGVSAIGATTITPTDVSTSLIPNPTITTNTTITTTGPDGSPTVIPEIIDCDVCGAAALLIFGLPAAAGPAVYAIPGVGLVPIGPGEVPLNSPQASLATATGSIPSGSVSRTGSSSIASESVGNDACELAIFNLGGDGEAEDESYATTSAGGSGPTATPSATPNPVTPTSTTTAAPTSAVPPPTTTQAPASASICAASSPQQTCSVAADCPCPQSNIPGCAITAACQPFDGDRPVCQCLPVQ